MDRTDASFGLRCSIVRLPYVSSRSLLAGVVAVSISALGGFARAEPPPPHPSLATLEAAAPGIDRDVLGLALRAVQCAQRRGTLDRTDVMTVIDYSRPSTEPRLWVLDVARARLLHEELVAHGQGSGVNHATQFSNRPGSHQSSLGLFATLDTYVGRHGRSLRLAGLEPGINHLAYERAIVVHGAAYVETAFASAHGRIGRSHGCPALSRAVAPRVIDTIRGGTPVFAYYPDREWLAQSTFLNGCEEARPDAVREAGRSSAKRRS